MEDRLRSKSLKAGIPLARLRKIVVFDRFLSRLIRIHPDKWILKGGFAIQLRLVDRARTTKDIDVLTLAEAQDVFDVLRQAGKVDLEDWFSFEVEKSEDQAFEEFGGARFHIRSLLDGRTFEDFHIDVGIGDPVIDPIDQVEGPSLLEFAGIQPAIIPCYPVTQQIAEKVHAYTRPHTSGESSRVKDFVDILLLAELEKIYSKRLDRAIRATFESRKTHSPPREVPDPPAEWSIPYQKLAAEVSLIYPTLDEANIAIKRFLNPILARMKKYRWDPDTWSWR
ncbi:MAG: nucleotidyl transferase AbiEii/AbiGii toxin family protein [Anaerolineales bacterium]|nr:nucleotidyl transferase AbiEii/AbiGii toxin family protein [Anaerolineales bacterium]